MELGEGSRVLRGGRRSEEHGKLGDTVGGKGKGNGIANSAPTRASQAPKLREIAGTDEDCTDADFDDEESTFIAATPTKRNPGRPKNGSKITTSQQPPMVDGTRGATNDRAELQATLKELIRELQESRNEIAELKTEWRAAVQRADNEIAELRSEFSDLKATTSQFIARPPATWATVASIGNGPTSADASWSALPASQRPSNDPTWSSRPSQMDINTYHVREKTVIVNIGPLRTEHATKTTEEFKELVQQELKTREPTKAVKVIGISKPARGRFELHTGDKKQAEAARKHSAWSKCLSEQAKVRGAAWYPVKVDGVLREAICKPEGTGWEFQDNAAARLGEQNSRPDFKVKVMKMHWLSPISTKLAGSMVIYLDSWPVAQQMVAEGTILVGPTMGFPSTYIQRDLPLRCYNCNQYGHMQGNCTKPAKCGNCSRAHQTRNCLGTEPEKCAACTGAHKVTDPRCTTFLKEVEKLRFKKSGRKEATTIPLCL